MQTDGEMDHTLLEKHLDNMIQRGHMYTYMEGELGRGICFTLGADFPETSWTGLLTKGSNGPDPIMQTLKNSRAAALSGHYGMLRDRLVEYKVAEFSTRAAMFRRMSELDAIYLAPPASANAVLEEICLEEL